MGDDCLCGLTWGPPSVTDEVVRRGDNPNGRCPIHPDPTDPDLDEYYPPDWGPRRMLDNLERLAMRSGCMRLRFGAIALNRRGFVVGRGWNHIPFSFRCSDQCAGGIRADVESGLRLERCYALHAEQHAILSGHGQPRVLHVAGWHPNRTRFPGTQFWCTMCVRVMADAGVRTVVLYDDDDRPQPRTISEARREAYEYVRSVEEAS